MRLLQILLLAIFLLATITKGVWAISDSNNTVSDSSSLSSFTEEGFTDGALISICAIVAFATGAAGFHVSRWNRKNECKELYLLHYLYTTAPQVEGAILTTTGAVKHVKTIWQQIFENMTSKEKEQTPTHVCVKSVKAINISGFMKLYDPNDDKFVEKHIRTFEPVWECILDNGLKIYFSIFGNRITWEGKTAPSKELMRDRDIMLALNTKNLISAKS